MCRISSERLLSPTASFSRISLARRGDSRSLDDQILQVQTNPQNNVAKLPAGKTWDNVILQEFSSKPTHTDDAADFRADALTLYKAVKATSPNVKPVLYETWAYRPSSTTAYSATPTPYQWTNAAQMQSELRSNYRLAKSDLDAVDGATTLLAAVGDKWEQAGFPNDLYDTYDDKHPSTRGSTLAALVLYASIYNENTSDIPFSAISAWGNAPRHHRVRLVPPDRLRRCQLRPAFEPDGRRHADGSVRKSDPRPGADHAGGAADAGRRIATSTQGVTPAELQRHRARDHQFHRAGRILGQARGGDGISNRCARCRFRRRRLADQSTSHERRQ